MTEPHDLDIPPNVVASFVFALAGFIFSAIAGVFVASDLLAVGAQQDLVDSAVPTIVALAVPGGLGALGGGWALISTLDRRRLGRSLAWAAVLLGAWSWLNLWGYAYRLRDVEDQLERAGAAVERAVGDQDPAAVGSYLNPEPGRWVTRDGQPCAWELVDLDGDVYDQSVGSEVLIDPAGTSELRTEPGCAWVFMG